MAVLGAIALAVAVAAGTAGSQSLGMTVTFLDVGQGESAWVHTCDDHDILIDGGEPAMATVVVGHLAQHGVTDPDAIFASHLDEDHVGGLAYVVKALPPRLFVSNGTTKETSAFHGLETPLAVNHVPTESARVGAELEWAAASGWTCFIRRG